MIKTGKGRISLTLLIAIWSVSAVTSLPGLAVAPILDKLTEKFNASQIEIEMLTSMPSFFIIPLILISGYLAVNNDKVKILVVGLVIFIGSGVGCLFSNSLLSLIIWSTVLGIGAGLIVPLSTGLISEYFEGKYRSAQLGISSSVTNITLVLSTIATGWLAGKSLHLPFVVYLLPIFALILSPLLRKPKTTPETDPIVAATKKTQTVVAQGKSYNFNALLGTMGLYLVVGYIVVVLIFRISFIVPEAKTAGMLSSILYLALMAPGFFINFLKKLYGRFAIAISIGFISVGMLIIVLTQHVFFIGVAIIILGFGYGFIQPVIYDKATQTSIPKKTTVTLAWVMGVNYFTIVITPWVINLFNDIFGFKENVLGPFIVATVMGFLMMIYAIIRSKHFVYKIDNDENTSSSDQMPPTHPTNKPTDDTAQQITQSDKKVIININYD